MGLARKEIYHPNEQGVYRASDDTALNMTLEKYLQLLDWSGRQVARNKVGRIPSHLAPILDRLGIRQEGWIDLVTSFGKLFWRIVGDPSAIEKRAAGSGKKWFQGIENCRQLFVGSGGE